MMSEEKTVMDCGQEDDLSDSEVAALRQDFCAWCRSEGLDDSLWLPQQPEAGFKQPRVMDYWQGYLAHARSAKRLVKIEVLAKKVVAAFDGVDQLERVDALSALKAMVGLDDEGEVGPTEEEKEAEYRAAGRERRPPRWVPGRVKVLGRVRSDLFDGNSVQAGEHDCTCNRYGAVSVIGSTGSPLGLKPDEFEVVSWVRGAQG